MVFLIPPPDGGGTDITEACAFGAATWR